MQKNQLLDSPGLLPCPFCNSDAFIIMVDTYQNGEDSDAPFFIVACSNNGHDEDTEPCIGSLHEHRYESIYRARQAWNTRGMPIPAYVSH